jgi:isopropylmalate/homocitrate/citramalate synthase
MDGRVLLWDVWSGQLVRECTVQHAAAGDETYFVDVLAAAVSGGGERMYTVDTWGGLTVFGLGTTCQKVPGSQFLDIEASNIIR